MEKTKKEKLREIEGQLETERNLLILDLTERITKDITAFKILPDTLRNEKDVAKIAFNRVGSSVWFSSEGLTL